MNLALCRMKLMRVLSVLRGLFVAPLLLISACSTRPDAPEEYPEDDPRNELASFEIAEGFEVTLFAAEPLVAKPIQMNWDAEGRLWVLTSTAYPLSKRSEEHTSELQSLMRIS